MRKAKETAEVPVAATSSGSQGQLKTLLDKNKEYHYNYEKAIEYKVPSGSLLLDYFLNGGLGPGLHRFCGVNEGGKAQPLSEPVLTRNGWVPIGDLKVGDKIIDSQGNDQEVIGVYPQGRKTTYLINFDDDCHTICCGDHLWETSSAQERRDWRNPARSVRSTIDIRKTLKRGNSWNHRVRKVKPIPFAEKQYEVDPLMLGRELSEKNDPEKTLPPEYKFGSIQQRLYLLAGLLTHSSQASAARQEMRFWTKSEKLRDDVAEVVWSLGGITQKTSNEGRVQFNLDFTLPEEVKDYDLMSKLHLAISSEPQRFGHFFRSVQKSTIEECVCIRVSSMDSLYITRDYILTHNTSSALQFMKNFLDRPTKRKGFYIKAEGRLSKEMIERSGVKFVFEHDKWVDGTCFVFESNIHETVFDALRELIGTNEEKIQYFFLLDSVDGLIRKSDLDKTFEESNKVAGGAVIASDLMKRVSIAMQKRGHIAVFISQVRADIKLDPYSKAPVRQTSATGGNALLHYANWIFEFETRFKGDLISLHPDQPYDEQKNPYLGHFVKVVIKKSPNERTNCVIKYPIKYGRKNGTSNWIEKEIFDFLLMWEIAVKKGSWIIFDEEFIETLKEAGFADFPAKIQGAANFEAFVSENEALKQFFYKYITTNLLQYTDGITVTEPEEATV